MTISAIGLDIGKKRIGVAVCDRLGWFASGLMTLENCSLQEVIATLRSLVEEREVTVLVVGLPYQMDGTLGRQAQQTQRTAQRIAQALELPLEWVDERLTSYAAAELLKAERIQASQHKGLVDRKAAAIILQQWLDQRCSRTTAETGQGK
jgi:putative Holliday junction resolvase